MQKPGIRIIYVLLFGFTLFCSSLFSQDLNITPDMLHIEQKKDGGYHLYIKKTDDIESILLTESSEAPDRKPNTFAYRNPRFHPVNGNEKRLLDGEFIDPAGSLIDSTVENHPVYGIVFHIYIPYVVEFGYSWSRNGELQFLDGTYFSIRAFEKEFADYSGSYQDNPFILRVTQKPLEGPPDENYMDDTVSEYTALAEEGKVYYSLGQEDLLTQLDAIIKNEDGPSLDLVLALDTTQSMHDDIPHLQKSLAEMVSGYAAKFKRFRVGIVLYKDYYEDYLTRTFQLTEDTGILQRTLNSIRVGGGRDIPEAVYEALYAGIHNIDWESDSRILVLVGDAPPHPRPRGRITEAVVKAEAEKAGILIYTIILPQ